LNKRAKKKKFFLEKGKKKLKKKKKKKGEMGRENMSDTERGQYENKI